MLQIQTFKIPKKIPPSSIKITKKTAIKNSITVRRIYSPLNCNLKSEDSTFIIYWGTKVWNIEINFVFFKKQIKRLILKLMSSKVWSIGIQKHKKDSASCSDTDTGHDTPLRRSIQTRGPPVVTLSFDVCSLHYFSFMKVPHNVVYVHSCIIILKNETGIHCSNTKRDNHWL